MTKIPYSSSIAIYILNFTKYYSNILIWSNANMLSFFSFVGNQICGLLLRSSHGKETFAHLESLRDLVRGTRRGQRTGNEMRHRCNVKRQARLNL